MTKMTWNSLAAIKLWGAPTEIDGVPLTLLQGKALMGSVENLMDDAGFNKDESIKRAVISFRQMFEVIDNEWSAKPEVTVHSGVKIRNKYYKADQKERLVAKLKRRMTDARRQQEKCRKITDNIIVEAGRRNSGRDKGRISVALTGLFDILNKEDQEEVLNALGKRSGKTVVRKVEG